MWVFLQKFCRDRQYQQYTHSLIFWLKSSVLIALSRTSESDDNVDDSVDWGPGSWERIDKAWGDDDGTGGVVSGSMEIVVTSRDFSMTSARWVRVKLSWLEMMTGFSISILLFDPHLELGGSISPVTSCLHFQWLLLVSLEVMWEGAECMEMWHCWEWDTWSGWIVGEMVELVGGGITLLWEVPTDAVSESCGNKDEITDAMAAGTFAAGVLRGGPS